MANTNLTSAKRAKNDEFYTQYPDIQKEIETYLEYDINTFRDKVIYCNCDDPLESNFFKYFVLHFKRLGLKRLITTSYKPSPIANTLFDLTPYDTVDPPKNRAKDSANRFIIDDVGDINNDGSFDLLDIHEKLRANINNEWEALSGDDQYPAGDFRSRECVELLQQSDIVVTNPPFSLFREYVAQLVDHEKKFLIIGNIGAISYKEIFPLIKHNKIWIGPSINSGDREFMVPKDYARNKLAVRKDELGNEYLRVNGVRWFTNLDHGVRHQPLNLMTMAENRKFNKKVINSETAYREYDNYDAIEVPFTDAIPTDYAGTMGVPISFLNKYDVSQFEIMGITKPAIDPHLRTKLYEKQLQVDRNGKRSEVTKLNDGAVLQIPEPVDTTYYVVNGRFYIQLYSRILIKHREAEK